MADAVHRRIARWRGWRHDAGPGTLYLDRRGDDSYFPELDRLSERIEALEDGVIERAPTARARRGPHHSSDGCSSCAASWRRCATWPTRCSGATGDSSSRHASVLPGSVRPPRPGPRPARPVPRPARRGPRCPHVIGEQQPERHHARLTAFTVVIMVPTLIAGIYGMNFDVMPELGLAVGIPVRAGPDGRWRRSSAILFFRRKGWF